MMEPVEFNYSLKNITTSDNRDDYIKVLIAKTGSFLKRTKWRLLYSKKERVERSKTIYFGLKSEKCPPADSELTRA